VIAGEYIQRFCGAKPVAAAGNSAASRIVYWSTTTTTLPPLTGAANNTYGFPVLMTQAPTVLSQNATVPLQVFQGQLVPTPAPFANAKEARPSDTGGSWIWWLIGGISALIGVLVATLGVWWYHNKKGTTRKGQRGFSPSTLSQSEVSEDDDADNDVMLRTDLMNSLMNKQRSQASMSQSERCTCGKVYTKQGARFCGFCGRQRV